MGSNLVIPKFNENQIVIKNISWDYIEIFKDLTEKTSKKYRICYSGYLIVTFLLIVFPLDNSICAMYVA